MAHSSRTRLLILTRQGDTAPSGQAVPTVSVGRELKDSRTASCRRSISIRQEAGYGRLVMSPIPASRRSSPARGDARKGIPYCDPLSQHRGLARVGRIDRSSQGGGRGARRSDRPKCRRAAVPRTACGSGTVPGDESAFGTQVARLVSPWLSTRSRHSCHYWTSHTTRRTAPGSLRAHRRAESRDPLVARAGGLGAGPPPPP
jgi:hypothetical protein